MRVFRLTLLMIGLVLALGSCSDSPHDPTVMLEHTVAPAQPWVATGELVDGEMMCPTGDRHRLRNWHPDGSQMTDEQFVRLAGVAFADGLDVWHVRRVMDVEYLCNDGSGAFTMRVDATGPVERATAEVMGGTGAYTNLTGGCLFDLTEAENREIATMIATCQFEFGSIE